MTHFEKHEWKATFGYFESDFQIVICRSVKLIVCELNSRITFELQFDSIGVAAKEKGIMHASKDLHHSNHTLNNWRQYYELNKSCRNIKRRKKASDEVVNAQK